jgi:hypothetical protein
MLRGDVTRLDFYMDGLGAWTISEFVLRDGVYLCKDRGRAHEFVLEETIEWLTEYGWIIHQWPGGMRAWKGEVRRVRSPEAGARLAREIKRDPRSSEELLKLLPTLDPTYDL